VLENLPEEQSAAQISIIDEYAIRVECFGNFRVFVGGDEVSQERWVSAKARDLLAYFVTFRGERIPAERAFDAIWGEKGSSRTAFHTALSRLRNALRYKDSTLRFIFVETGEYWLDSARFKIDVDEFNNAILNARSSTNAQVAVTWYERAAGLYKGDYLKNLYFEWVFAERRSLAKIYLDSLQELVAYYATGPDPRSALDYFEKAKLIDNLCEDIYRHAMRAYATMGDRGGIARVFQDLEQTLWDELEIKPSASTVSLYKNQLEILDS
jgi:two-component SAPR family response regulator